MADKTFGIDLTKAGAKPPVGIGTGTQNLYRYDETGRIVENRNFGGSGIDKSQRVEATNPEEARIGDYYYDSNGNLNVVPSSPTDIYNRWRYTEDALSVKPTREMFSSGNTPQGFIETSVAGAAGAGGALRAIRAAAKAGTAYTGIGVAGSAAMAALPMAALQGVIYATQVGAEEKAYRRALDDWNKEQERANWKIAGDIRTDEDGNVYFKSDASKAMKMNPMYAGTQLKGAYDSDTNVYFGDDGRLKIKVNPLYAATDEFKELVENIKKGYATLTPNDVDADEAINTIKQYIDTGNTQFKFREQSLYAYKNELPNASEDVIDDAYTNEMGAYMSEEDGGDYSVKVYRDGEIVEQTAKEVLENLYNKNLGERSDYILSLQSKMNDPSISDDDKAYILGELKLLYAADENENTYDNGAKNENGDSIKTINKYHGMLDQESIIPWLTNPVVFGLSVSDIVNGINHITPWDMNLNTQEGLQPDPVAKSAAQIIGTATSAISSIWAMGKIEHGLLRPAVGKIGDKLGKAFSLENLAARGGRLSDIVGNIQLTSGAFANYVRERFPNFAEAIAGAKLAASPIVKTLGYSMSELLYNATSDLIFDSLKQAQKAIAGEEPTAEEFANELGADFALDLIMQYGPAGIASMQTEFINNRLDTVYEPYREKIDTALGDLTSAELEYQAAQDSIADMRKGTKKYKAAKEDLDNKEKAYNKAKKKYDGVRKEADAALKEAYPTASEEIGAALAGRISKVEQNKVIMWLRKKLTDENAGLTTVAQQAYAKTRDVYFYSAALNKFQSIQSNIKEVKTKMLLDMYIKGTGESYTKLADAVATATNGGVRFSKEQIQYLVAKAEYDAWSRNAGDDAETMKKVEEKYLPYIDKVQGVEREQLDNVLENITDFLKKVGENYVKSGAATKKQMKDIESAALGDGYIPLWGNNAESKRVGLFETPLNLRVGRNFNPDKGLFDVDGVANPVESAMAYTNNIINNIARNEMAAMLKDVASIGGIDVELSGASTGGEYQDIITQAIDRVSRSKEKILTLEVSEEGYNKGLKQRLSRKANKAAIFGIDGLREMQSKLQEAVDRHNRKDYDYTEDELTRLKTSDRAETRRIRASAARRSLDNINVLKQSLEFQKQQVRVDIDNRVRAAGEYFNETYNDFGFKVDVEDTLSSSKYTEKIDSRLDSMTDEDLIALKTDIDTVISQVAPYLPIQKINKKVVSSADRGLRVHTRNRLKKENPDMTNEEINRIVNKVSANFKNQLTGDFTGFDTSDAGSGSGGGYKINFTLNGEDASFYITGKLAKEVAAEMNTKNVNDRRAITEFFKQAANIKRLLTTGIDPTRVLPNMLRDTIRNYITSGGTDYWFYDNSPFGFREMFTMQAKAAGDTDEDIAHALNVMKASQDIASGATYNESFSTGRSGATKRLVQVSIQNGKNRATRIVWDIAHNKRGMLEAPMNWAEGLTRNRAAASAFYRAYMRGAGTIDQEVRLNNAFQAGINAGRENTVNFSRRGTAIKQIAAYVPYLSQRFSSIESTKIAFLKDPVGFSSRLMMFGAAYMSELARTLSNDESRKNYYNLSEYDRENNIILSMGDNTLVTIPLDETIAALIYPWRRGLEVMHDVDPEDFYKIMVDGFVELSPFDLSGFTEGDSFNFGRGLEKLGAQMLPTIAQSLYTQASGRNMYYGSTVSVSSDTLAEYGNYSPTKGDYTNASANSKLLRGIADTFGIEQWRLQQLIADLGGNVGQYTVNMLDKIAGAPESEQGGKDFVDATFKSFTGMDSEQVKYAFNDGIAKLEQEKNNVISRLKSLNSQISLASGERLYELKSEYTKVKQEFAMKINNFVEKYINGYEIAGGLNKSQANRIWYLLNFSDDDSTVMAGSLEADYRSSARTEANSDTTKYAASVLDKYYDQTKSVYKDSEGKWHYSSPYGEQAFFNTIRGRGAQHMINLKNIVEDDNSPLYSLRTQTKQARSSAANAGNWDEYDRLGLVFDGKMIDAIAPYINTYGAENMLYDNTVLDYLREWFFVPSSYMKSKYGKNVSLAHNASKQEAFVEPYIKELFGLTTAYQNRGYAERPERLVKGE